MNKENKGNKENKQQGPAGGGPKDSMKNRLPISEMKEPIIKFCEEQNQMYIAENNGTDFPSLEIVEYRYVSGTHLIVLTPASMFLSKFEVGSKFSGFIFPSDGKGLKSTKRIYGSFICQEVDLEGDFIKTLAKTDDFVKKMSTHGAKFFTLDVEKLTAFFGGNEIFTLDKDMNPSFSEFAPNGKKRYENSHHVLMEYNGRDVIFNTIIEGDTYYTLTKADSNKMNYIKDGGECKFYDGRDRHFTSKVTIIEDAKQIEEIFQKLVDTNHAFFKSNKGLVALSYTYSK